MRKLRNPSCVRFFGLLALAGFGLAGAVSAQSLSDPTRPAPEWLAAQPPVAGAVAAQDVAATPGVLRVLVIGHTRKFAIIDRQLVRYGETYNGSKLVGINPDGVVLQKDGRKEKLSMNPAVEKRIKSHKPLASKGGSGKKMLKGKGQ